MTTQVDQNREDEDGRISQDTATPTAGTNQADTQCELAITELLQRLYNKARIVQDKNTGDEFLAIHHKDVDYEYWKLTGGTMR